MKESTMNLTVNRYSVEWHSHRQRSQKRCAIDRVCGGEATSGRGTFLKDGKVDGAIDQPLCKRCAVERVTRMGLEGVLTIEQVHRALGELL